MISKYNVFDLKYALDLKENWPEIWNRSGNIFGNIQFMKLIPILARGGDPENKEEEKTLALRELWAIKHFEDFRFASVISQVKWLTVGSRGEKYMKDLIDFAKKKIDKKKHRNTMILMNDFILKSNFSEEQMLFFVDLFSIGFD